MKKRVTLLLSALLVAVVVSAAEKVSETRKLSGYEKIEINGSPNVVYTQGKTFSVRVEGKRESVDNVETSVSGNTLYVKNKGKVGIFNFTTGSSDDAVVYVTSPDLISIRVNGSGDFISKTQIDTDRMTIVLRGSGDIDVKDIICDACNITLIGSGDVDLDRLEARDVNASLVGSGDIDLALLKVNVTRLYVKGSGDMKADFREGCGSVECQLTGSGDITLSGKVKHISKQKHGSGDIHINKLAVEK